MGVSIVVGHYCELNSHLTGIIYVLLTDRRSKLRISLSIRLASEIIILLASYQSFACNNGHLEALVTIVLWSFSNSAM